MKELDKVPYDEETGKFYKHLLEYASEVGSIKFEVQDISLWKRGELEKVKNVFKQDLVEINERIQKLMDEIVLNDVLYSSNMNFEPIVGHTYYLYENKKGEKFLSLIEPELWNMPYLGSYKLNSDKKWVSIKNS
jgi:hypothetical protein